MYLSFDRLCSFFGLKVHFDSEQNKVDIALVVERINSGNYLVHKTLPLSWLYSNARHVKRPYSDWVVTEDIEIRNEVEE